MLSTKKKIPGEDLPLPVLILCIAWVLPISIFTSIIKKFMHLFFPQGMQEPDEIESALASWNFEKKVTESAVSNYFYYRTSTTLASSKGLSLIVLVIGPSLYCQSAGFSPIEILRRILCSLLEELPNASLLIISGEWINGDAFDLDKLASLFIVDNLQVYKYAIDYNLAEKFNIQTLPGDKLHHAPCRLCLPMVSSPSSFITVKEMLAIFNSILLRLITSGWPYKCKLRSTSQLRSQLSLEIGDETWVCFDLILQIIQHQIRIFGELALASQLLAAWCIQRFLKQVL